VSMTSGGVRRAYWRHVPPRARARRPLPLVVDLHGYMEPAGAHKANSALGVFGDHHGFVTITPEGSGPVPHWDTHFDSADMVFIGELLDEANRTLCVDERRVYVSGYSNGAFMASTIACVYADRVAAVATVAGIREVPGCAPARPVPVVAFHGTADEWLSFTGGVGPKVDALPEPGQQQTRDSAAPSESGLSIPGVAAAWAARNGCGPTPTESQVAADVRVVRYPCASGADVALYVVEGGGHTWPGSRFSKAIAQFVGPTTLSIDADAVMWRFFQRHPLPGNGTAS
jgi:polyhydroxybutyrate depolymerase